MLEIVSDWHPIGFEILILNGIFQPKKQKKLKQMCDLRKYACCNKMSARKSFKIRCVVIIVPDTI